MMLPRPLPNLDIVLPITEQFAEYIERAGDFEAQGAIGLIETKGFPAMVGAADAAMKCANVELITYETTGAGLCTAVLQGPIADVTMAVEAGMQAAERIGDLHAIMVIPRPLDELMRVMPKPPHLVAVPEERQALNFPEREVERDRIALPELERVPVPIEISIAHTEPQAPLELQQPLEFGQPEVLRVQDSPAQESPAQTEHSLTATNLTKNLKIPTQALLMEGTAQALPVRQQSLPLPIAEPLRLDPAKSKPSEEDSQ